MEFDLDAMFPKGVVDDATRREVLTELLRNARKRLTRQLRQAIVFTLFCAMLTAYSVWMLVERDALPWFWVPFGLFEGALLVVWAWVWNEILKDRDKVDTAMSDLKKESTSV